MKSTTYGASRGCRAVFCETIKEEMLKKMIGWNLKMNSSAWPEPSFLPGLKWAVANLTF